MSICELLLLGSSGRSRTSYSARNLLDSRVVLTLNHSPNRIEGNSESARQFPNMFDLLVSLTTSPRKTDSTLAVDREVVHLGDSEFCILSLDELNETATFSGWNLAVGDFSEVLEEAL